MVPRLIFEGEGRSHPAVWILLDTCYSGLGVHDAVSSLADHLGRTVTSDVRCWFLAAARPKDEASEGAFVSALVETVNEVLHNPAFGGASQPTISLSSVSRGINDCLKKRSVKQEVFPTAVGEDADFLHNPRYQGGLAGYDLESQTLFSHWIVKAKGVGMEQPGWFFSGRHAALRTVVGWLNDRRREGGLYVVRGDPGSGKSAVLGRVVTVADPQVRLQLQNQGWLEGVPADTLPAEGSVDLALHAHGMQLQQLRSDLSTAAGISSNLLQDLLEALERREHPLRVVIDAVDEAQEPREFVRQGLRSFARARGIKLVVGTRRNLLSLLGEPLDKVDLDAEYGDPEAISDYEQRILHSLPQGLPSDYANQPDAAKAVATAVGKLAGRSFLIARLAARRLAQEPVPDLKETGWETKLGVVADWRDAHEQELARLGEHRQKVEDVLKPLAYACGRGLPWERIWASLASAISGKPYSDEDIADVQQRAGYLIVEDEEDGVSVYRLLHETLGEYLRLRRPPQIELDLNERSMNDHLRAQPDALAVKRRIAFALQQDVDRYGGWEFANPYVVRYLPVHLSDDPERLELLCTNPFYLRRALAFLGADRLGDLLIAAQRASSRFAIEAVAKSVRRARVALSRDPDQLATQLHARLAWESEPVLRSLIDALPSSAPPVWLRSCTAGLGWRADLETMQTFNAKVRALAFGILDGASVIAVGAGTDINLWNPRSGEPGSRISNDGLRVTGLALGTVEGREVVAVAAGYDGVSMIRDLRTGACIGEPLVGIPLAIGKLDDRDVVALAGEKATITRTLDTKGPVVECAYEGEVVGQRAGALIVVSRVGSKYHMLDLSTKKHVGSGLDAPGDRNLVAVGEWRGSPVLCFASYEGRAEVRDLQSGEPVGEPVHFNFRVRTLAVGGVDGDLVVVAGNDTDADSGYVAIRQPMSGQPSSRPLDAALQGLRVLGVGRADGRLVLLLEGVGAVDPVTSEVVVPGPVPPAAVELLNGVASTPVVPASPPLRSTGGRFAPRLTLRRKAPMRWPITCDAWGVIDGRIIQARGSHKGAVWILDPVEMRIVHGPYSSVPSTVVVNMAIRKGRIVGPSRMLLWPRGKAEASSPRQITVARTFSTWKPSGSSDRPRPASPRSRLSPSARSTASRFLVLEARAGRSPSGKDHHCAGWPASRSMLVLPACGSAEAPSSHVQRTTDSTCSTLSQSFSGRPSSNSVVLRAYPVRWRIG
jgi:AAA ATPase-like protein